MKQYVVALLISLAAVGCKQGRGERCQVDADCAEGNCSQSEPRVCGGEDATQQDAEVPIQIDAGP